jgi:hypothetical protein
MLFLQEISLFTLLSLGSYSISENIFVSFPSGKLEGPRAAGLQPRATENTLETLFMQLC